MKSFPLISVFFEHPTEKTSTKLREKKENTGRHADGLFYIIKTVAYHQFVCPGIIFPNRIDAYIICIPEKESVLVGVTDDNGHNFMVTI